jgi:hypothetical protein
MIWPEEDFENITYSGFSTAISVASVSKNLSAFLMATMKYSTFRSRPRS